MSECTCQHTEPHYPAADHDEHCPRFQNQCEHCDGLGCGLCDDTGNFFSPPAPEVK